MELNFDVEKINYLEMLLKRSAAKDEMTEVIVPDTLPDAAEIVHAEGIALLRGKDSDENGMTVSGVVEASVLYLPYDEDKLRKVDVVIPFSVCAEADNLNGECMLTANVSLKKISANILNPRKLVVSVEVIADMRAYLPAETEIANCNDGCEDVEILKNSMTVEAPSEVSEKTFVINDELTAGNRTDIGELLFTSAGIYEEETKGIGNKTVVRGRIVTDVVYMPTQGGCPESLRFSSPFSQIIEFNGNCEENTLETVLTLTGVYVTKGMPNADGESVLELEVHAVAQCVSYENIEICYVEDAYSTKYDLETVNDTVALPKAVRQFSAAKTVMCSVETGTRARDIIKTSVMRGNAQLNNGSISANMNVSVIYSDDNGGVHTENVTVKAEMECPLDCEEVVIANAEWEGESFASASVGGIEIRFPVKFSAITYSSEKIAALSGIAYDEMSPRDNSNIPSLTVYKTRGDDDLWALGKKYCSTSELILQANGLEGNAPMRPDMVIVIPKKR